MVQLQNMQSVHVIWKGRKFSLELSLFASLKELGDELRVLTDVKADTMRLIIPQSSTKTSKLFMPFSDEHSWIRLLDTGIAEGKPLRMMGVYEHEIDQLLKDAKANSRIAGFEDEEKRMKQRMSGRPQVSHKLPQGPYIFSDFRTLELPGLQLNPPPVEALKRMHMLASDPGIVAIMNKHRWRVGIMTEMAPVGYVGISPVCLLGFNKNAGEEISLRLRTDDLKGFRKYESIKKTLLHELAHMVYSEHDSNFYALDKQLNQEAFALDWTRSRGHTLTDTRFSRHDNLDMDFEPESSLPQKLGGITSHMAIAAREASVAAAYHRLEDSFTNSQGSSAYKEEGSDDHTSKSQSTTLSSEKEELLTNPHDDCYHNHDSQEPNPDDSRARETMVSEPYGEANEGVTQGKVNGGFEFGTTQEEPDPDDSEISESKLAVEPRALDSQAMQIDSITRNMLKATDEPDPDDLEARTGDQPQVTMVHAEPDPDDARANRMQRAEPDPDDRFEPLPQSPMTMTDEPDPDDEELKRIQDPVNVFCNKLTKAIHELLSDFKPSESKVVLETLLEIIRNVSQNPAEVKYKKLRKANPTLQRNIVSYKAAMEVLFLIGFSDDIGTDESGKSETYLVLKRNDPALLWLAKSTIDSYIS